MHFSVLVVGDDVDSQLAPFDENAMGDEPEIDKTYDELLDLHKGEIDTKDPISWLKNYYGEDNIDDEGNYVVYYNLDGQWDWYQIGGRWDDLIILKDGVSYDDSKIITCPISATTGQTFRALKKDIFNLKELPDLFYAAVSGNWWTEDKNDIRDILNNAGEDQWITVVDCHT